MMVHPSNQQVPGGGPNDREASGSIDQSFTGSRDDPMIADPLAQFENLDNLTVDDLLSLGSPQHSTSEVEPVDGAEASSPEHWRVHHPGVHMVVQENAKMPTFYFPVNRSATRANATASTNDNMSSPSNSRASSISLNLPSLFDSRGTGQRQSAGFAKRPPSIPRPPDASRLGEHFLNHARGRHQNITFHRHALHNHAGAPTATENPNNSAQKGSTGKSTVIDPLDALLAADLKDVDPTPLSEIRLRHESYLRNSASPPMGAKAEQTTQQQQPQSKTEQNHAQPQSTLQQVRQPKQNALVGRYRPDHLPIPTKKISPPSSPPGNARRRVQQPQNAKNSGERSTPARNGSISPTTKAHNGLNNSVTSPSSSSRPTVARAASATATVQVTSRATTANRNGTATTSAGKAPPYNKPAPSIHHASAKKTQYGFGSNHVVASVPPLVAPRKRKPSPPPTSGISTQVTAKATTVAGSGVRQQNMLSATPVALAHSTAAAAAAAAVAAAGTNQGAAYERKKQRAKDARVKLNESIERLSVAIALAGTQSRERCEQWAALPVPGASRQASLDICQECVGTAENAKKWDRPSFVGSAASLIQSMNAQCEALMRELVTLHQQHESDLGRVVNTPEENQLPAESAPLPPEAGAGEASSTPSKREASLNEDEASPSKRQRVEQPVHAQPQGDIGLRWTTTVFSEPKVMKHIASFLDPVSLLRCSVVSKEFKTLDVFYSEQIWQDLAAARFGYFNVRQWHAKLDDEEEGIKVPSTTLYRSMDRANVMPPFAHEGMFLLGEARLPNKVSAWSFLVERSNGETLRSIRRKADMLGRGDYTSLPVVELRTIVQNTGASNDVIAIRDQTLTVDSSTRRRGEEMKEIDWDPRLQKRLENLDGTPFRSVTPRNHGFLHRHHPNRAVDLAHLRLYESVVIVSYIYARGCSTNSKFVQRSNFSKILVGLNTGVTVPLVIPFPRDASHLQH